MRIVQHNCRKNYAITIAALETGLNTGAEVVCLQEPYIHNEFNHGSFLLFWPEKGEQKNKRVLIAVRRELLNQANLEARTDLIDHPYFLALDIWELDGGPLRKQVRRTRIINCYDNWIGRGCVWQGDVVQRRRALEDVNWESMLQGRAILMGDFNAHSPLWNPQARTRSNAAPLEALIRQHGLQIENDPELPTRPKSSPGISIIDLTLTTREMGALTSWAIHTEHSTGSDHELILLEWPDVAEPTPEISTEITGWQIQTLLEDQDAADKAKAAWEEKAAQRMRLSDSCSSESVVEEAEWLQSTLTEVLNQNAKALRVSAFSKRWWNAEIKEKRRQFARARRAWKAGNITEESLREARNGFYCTIRRAKRECWSKFLSGGESSREKLGSEDTARCWQALRYTKPQTTGATPALSGPEGQSVTSTQEKAALIKAVTFPTTWNGEPMPESTAEGTWHQQIRTHKVQKALFSQATKKAPGPDKLNFRALRLLWSWDAPRVTALVRQCARLGLHPRPWKTARGVILRKTGNNRNYSLANSYRVICLLNCMGKVVEKLATEAIATHCEATGALHIGQMGGRKYRGALDAVACLMQDVHQAWAQKQLAGVLLLDVKGAFPFVNPIILVRRMEELEIDGDLIRWTQSFMTERSVQLVLDGFTCTDQIVNSGLPQGSPVSPVLFAIYLSGLFTSIEGEVPEVRCLSFADDIGLVTSGNAVSQVCVRLQKAAEAAEDWGRMHGVRFDVEKTEAILFTKKTGRRRRELIESARIQIGEHRVSFNQEATKWLGVWLDAGLTLKTHFKSRLQKAQTVEKRVRALCKKQGLAPGLVRRIQIAVVQSTALYGAELWWRGQKEDAQSLQKLINQQARAITGAFRSTPIGPLLKNAGLEPAELVLQTRQRSFAARLLKAPSNQPAHHVLPVSFREGDRHAQPGEQPLEDRGWAEQTPRGPYSLGQHLAKQLAEVLPTDPSGGFEGTKVPQQEAFAGQILIQSRDEALETANGFVDGLVLWTDGSRLDNGKIGAAVAWQDIFDSWHTRELPLGRGKEVFDAELSGACEALRLAKSLQSTGPVTVFMDSQAAINRLQHAEPGAGQEVVFEAWKAAKALAAEGRELTIRWVPSHQGVPGNEQADQAAKRAAARPPPITEEKISLAHVSRARTKAKEIGRQKWLKNALKRRAPEHRRVFEGDKGWGLEPGVAAAPKAIASRYFQLKTGHAAIGVHLARIKARERGRCPHCGGANESVRHVLLDCRKWRVQRRTLLRELDKAGVPQPSAMEEHPESRLLGNAKASRALLNFLTTTTVGCFEGEADRAATRARADDEWGLAELEEEERRGEG
jgi:ribonuclease HI